MKKLLGTAFVGNLLLAGVLLGTMDMDLGGGAPRRALECLIDGYEIIGFGTLRVGLVLVAVVLGFAWLWLRARGSGAGRLSQRP